MIRSPGTVTHFAFLDQERVNGWLCHKDLSLTPRGLQCMCWGSELSGLVASGSSTLSHGHTHAHAHAHSCMHVQVLGVL